MTGINIAISLSTCLIHAIIFNRNASRTVHVPFFQPSHQVTEAEKSAAEEAMKIARMEASASLGELIAVGQQFTTERVQECIHVVSSVMPRMGYRTHKSYATVLAFSLLVS